MSSVAVRSSGVSIEVSFVCCRGGQLKALQEAVPPAAVHDWFQTLEAAAARSRSPCGQLELWQELVPASPLCLCM